VEGALCRFSGEGGGLVVDRWLAGGSAVLALVVVEPGMGRPPVFSAEEKVHIVLSILAGGITARRRRGGRASEQSVGELEAPVPAGLLQSREASV